MRQKGQPLAVVIDEHGTVAGIATVEDLVEEIVAQVVTMVSLLCRMWCAKRMAAW